MYIWQHFKTITKHKLLVTKFCFKSGLYKQGILHDLSKYTPEEFFEGVKYYRGIESPNNEARRRTGYSRAWLHHKGRNKHHFDYWLDYGMNCKTIIQGVDMPRKYIAELVCDRIAASMVYNPAEYNDTYPLNYYTRGEHELWFVSENTRREVKYLLTMVAKRGHDYTFRYIKNKYLRSERL